MMYANYFHDYEVRPEFEKEFVSLWPGWLGSENSHKLDEVKEHDWSKFNCFMRLIASNYEMWIASLEEQSLSKIHNIEDRLSGYEASKRKDSSQFSRYLLPALECVVTEEWDYTYIIWHKKNGAVEALMPLVADVGLFSFHD